MIAAIALGITTVLSLAFLTREHISRVKVRKDAESFKEKCNVLDSECEKLSASLTAETSYRRKFEEESKSLQNEIEDRNRTIRNLRQDVEQEQSNSTNLQIALNETETTLESIKRQQAELQYKLKNISEDRTSLSTLLAEEKAKVDSLEENNAALSSETENLKASLAKERSATVDLHSELESKISALARSEDSYWLLKAEIAVTKGELHEAKMLSEELNHKLDLKNAECDSLSESLSIEQGKVATLEVASRKADADLLTMNDAISSSETEINRLKSELAGLDDNVKNTRQMLDLKDAELTAVSASLRELERIVQEKDGRMQTLEQELHDVEDALEAERALVAGQDEQIETQRLLFEHLTTQFRHELGLRESEIIRLRELVEKLEARKTERMSILKNMPFLRRLTEDETPDLTKEYRSIRYVCSDEDDSLFEIQYDNLHTDEKKLSELRVRLYEQLQSNPESPLLRCACCKQPVLLSGNSGIKGAIIGFRHQGEGNNYTGEHVGENYNLPKQESLLELESTSGFFSIYAPYLDGYTKHPSFLVMPGTVRNYSGDVTFTYNGKNIAVIFASAGHPLDFIVRRTRAAVDAGYTPIWILSPAYFSSTVISNRDISVFSKGYICTIDRETVNIFYQSQEMCLHARDYHTDQYSYIKLSTFISDSEKDVEDLLANHKESPQKRTRIVRREPVAEPVSSPVETTIEKKPSTPRTKKATTDTAQTKIARQKYTYSAYDYWEGRRFHIKGNLYVEKIGETFGILDMSTWRYHVLPIYDNIVLSEDKTSAQLILNGNIERTVDLSH